MFPNRTALDTTQRLPSRAFRRSHSTIFTFCVTSYPDNAFANNQGNAHHNYCQIANMVTPKRAFAGSNIFSHDPGPTRRSRQKTYPIQRLITLHKLVLRKLSQVRPTQRVLPGSSRALLACGMISCGEHSQKGSGNRRTIFSLLCFFLFSSGVFLTHPVSLLLSTLRVSWCMCHSLDLSFWLGGFPGAWMLFRGGGFSQSHGIDGAISGDRFVCALGASAAKQPTTNHISLAVSIYQALSSHQGQGSRQQLSDGGQLRVLAIDCPAQIECNENDLKENTSSRSS